MNRLLGKCGHLIRPCLLHINYSQGNREHSGSIARQPTLNGSEALPSSVFKTFQRQILLHTTCLGGYYVFDTPYNPFCDSVSPSVMKQSSVPSRADVMAACGLSGP